MPEGVFKLRQMRMGPLSLGLLLFSQILVHFVALPAKGIWDSSHFKEFSPSLYLTENQCVFEGRLLSDKEVFEQNLLVPQSGETDWYYRTKQAIVLVEKVWKDLPNRLSKGDTISFLYPVGQGAYNAAKPGYTSFKGHPNNAPLGIVEGTSSLFCLNIGPKGEFLKGEYFLLKSNQKAEVKEYLERIENDPFFSALLYGGMER